jgi:uncharacterized repeat protein (TIGR03803 family)
MLARGTASLSAAAIGILACNAPAFAWKETVLYSFKGGKDGAYPGGPLTYLDGALYGVTAGGGGGNCIDGPGCGIVFKLTLAGTKTVLHTFGKGFDGGAPDSKLTYVNGTFYGTTFSGGRHDLGTVFSITPDGTESVVYSFNGTDDNPEAGLIDVGRALYGTTTGGVPNGPGTVFKVTTSGREKVIYAFKTTNDASLSLSGLIDFGNALYGTSVAGGASGYGSIFAVTRAGVETELFSFNFLDGGLPYCNLINVGGSLYGTTSAGGANDVGTVFKFTQDGTMTVIYSFSGYYVNTSDGAEPFAGLVEWNGTLYGTTKIGGGTGCGNGRGCGTVFAVTPDGDETVIHPFSGKKDGHSPISGLIRVGDALYGTTPYGGAYNKGTVFRITP